MSPEGIKIATPKQLKHGDVEAEGLAPSAAHLEV
jgi:hypothetical protein